MQTIAATYKCARDGASKESLQLRLIAGATLQNGDRSNIFPPAVEIPILKYIASLGVGKETAREMIQTARMEMWRALKERSRDDCYEYLIKTGLGAVRRYRRDKDYTGLARVPAYLHDRHKAAEHYLFAASEQDCENASYQENAYDEVLEQVLRKTERALIQSLLRKLTRAQRNVMRLLMKGFTVTEVAKRRKVRPGCIYAQRAAAVARLSEMVKQLRGEGENVGNQVAAAQVKDKK